MHVRSKMLLESSSKVLLSVAWWRVPPLDGISERLDQGR